MGMNVDLGKTDLYLATPVNWHFEDAVGGSVFALKGQGHECRHHPLPLQGGYF